MGKFTFTQTEIPGVVVIEPQVFGDDRGYFMETYNYNDFAAAGIDCTFVQDNQSSSKKGVLRGLHFQINYPQDKLVRVVSGEVFDVDAAIEYSMEQFVETLHKKLADAEGKVIFGGRLGEYKYYDMDQVIAAVLDKCASELGEA